LGRVDGAAGQDDVFAVCRQGFSLALVLDADGSLILQNEPFGQGMGTHNQIGALRCRPQIGNRRAAAFSISLRHLVEIKAALLWAIEVVCPGMTGLVGGVQKNL